MSDHSRPRRALQRSAACPGSAVGRVQCAPCARGEVCRWLLQTHDCVDGDAIPLTQEFLGQMLGARRTTVTVAARLLQSAGLIRYRRGHIQILDRKALEDISCECYAVVRHITNKVFSTAPGSRCGTPSGGRHRRLKRVAIIVFESWLPALTR